MLIKLLCGLRKTKYNRLFGIVKFAY